MCTEKNVLDNKKSLWTKHGFAITGLRQKDSLCSRNTLIFR